MPFHSEVDLESPANSLRLDPRRQMRLEDDELEAMVDALCEYCDLRSRRRDTLSSMAVALKVFWGNLHLARRQGRWLAISLRSNDFSVSRHSVTDFGYPNFKRVVDYYKKNCPEVEVKIGYKDRRTGVGRTTRLRIKDINQDEENREEENPLRRPLELSLWSITDSTSAPRFFLDTVPLPEVLHLKDHEKKLCSYGDTDETHQMREELVSWNEFALGHWPDLFLSNDDFKNFRLPLTERRDQDYSEDEHLDRHYVDLSSRQLYRVFNRSSFEHGGRLYGAWWQAIPSIYRHSITINAHPTAEIDYSNMQIAMLYNRRQAVLGGDAYELDGIAPSYRKILKKVLQQLINAREDQDIRPPHDDDLPPGYTFEQLCAALREKHSVIADDFRSGVGLRLQKEDADIAIAVIRTMADEGELALPVHDSFLVKESRASRLKEVMLETYRERLGRNIGVSEDDLLSTGFRLPDDDDAAEIDLGGEPAYFHRMNEQYFSDEFSEYRKRQQSFISQRPSSWQFANSGGPLW